MRKRTVFTVAALSAVAGAALIATTVASARPAASAKAAAISCKSTMKIGFVTPLTGGAGFLGQEQLSWAKFSVATLPKQFGLKIKLLSFDTPVEAGPAPAQAVAQ